MQGPRRQVEASFIVIAYNAQRTVRRCIESILAQSVQKEILLVDNNSTDGTVAEVRDLPVTILFEAERSRGAARNRGLSAARGNYIVFVDSDVELPQTWASGALHLLNRHPEVVAVGGPGLTPKPSWVSRALDVLQYGRLSGGKDRYVASLPTMATLYRGACIRHMRFARFWTGEDAEFNLQLSEQGRKFLWSAGLAVWHHHAQALAPLAMKSFLYGKWLLAPYWRHPGKITPGVVARASYFPVLAVMAALAYAFPDLLALPALWIAAPVLAYFHAALRGRLVLRPRLTIEFLIVHSIRQYAQMAGVWAGVIDGTWRKFG